MPGQIIGTGVSLPERVMTNDDLARIVDTSDKWIRERTGIGARHIASDDENTSDLCVAACRDAARNAAIDLQSIDLIICATNTPDYPFPATAALVQHKLGIEECGGFDLQAGCTSFVYGLELAARMVDQPHIRHVLVVGGEVLSRFLNWEDRTTCVLFGDGAGAVVVGSAPEGNGVLASWLGVDGSMDQSICLPAGGSARRFDENTLGAGDHFIHMDGQRVYKWAVRAVAKCIVRGLELVGWDKSDLDWVVPHQANQRILQAVAEDLGLPIERFISNIENYGNTSAASIPIALHEALTDGRIRAGQRIVTVGFGAGLTMGTNVIQL